MGKEKLRMDWIPPKALMEVAKVFTKGSSQNRDSPILRETDKLDEWTAMQRHAWKWRDGETYDKDSKLNHLAHAAARALLALEEEL